MRKKFSIKLLLENLNGMVYRCKLDKQWTMEYLSPKLKDLTGYSPEVFSQNGRVSYASIIYPDDREHVEQEIERAIQAGEAFEVTYRIIDATGNMKWVWEQGQAVHDASGRVVALEGFVTDVTKQKQTEDELRYSNQRLSLILQSSGEGIFGIDEHYCCTFINTTGATMLGYDPDEMIGRRVDDLIQHHRCDGSICSGEPWRLLKAVNDGVTVRIEDEVFHRKDGTCFPVAYSVSPKITVNSEPRGAVVVFTDITERQRIEKKEQQAAAEARVVAEANAKYRAFFNQAAHFAGVLEPDGSLVEANHVSIEGCGYRRDEVIGKKFWECGWWHRSPQAMELVRQGCSTAAAGSLFRQEITYFLADGTERLADVLIAPVTNGAGRVLYIAATGYDVTDRKRAEEALRASEERFRLLTELSPDAILVELNGQFVYANPSAASLFGAKQPSSVLGLNAFDCIDPEFHEVAKARRSLVLEEKQKAPLMEVRMRRIDGSPVDVQVACAKVSWEGQPAVQLLLRDITEHKQAREKLRLMSERLQIAIEGAGEGIWDWNITNNTFTFSGGLNKILDAVEDSVLSTDTQWHRAIHPDDKERVLSVFQDALNEKVPLYECEYRIRAKDGEWKWVKARGLIVERDDSGKPRTMTGTLVDITARKEADEAAWRHANLDSLTGLPNRRLLRERLASELRKAKRTNHQLALLFIDLDGFKQVNDIYGHDQGDKLLIEAALRLKSCVRETDTVARLGGDEFTVILTGLEDINHVEFVCQKIIASLNEAFYVGNDSAYVSGSIGVSLYPLDGVTSEDILRKADQAMYAAKHSGKSQFKFFTKEMDEKAHWRLRIANELRHALNAKQLSVHYQPVVDLRNGRIVKAEALLRWHHPTLGNIEPSLFIPIAEESGLIRQIGHWVFMEAVACCKHCIEQLGTPFQIGVNQSPLQFTARPSDANWIGYLSKQGIPCDSIAIEITEGVLLHAMPNITNTLLEYRDAGIEVALDDFGTGYSSMSYLQKFDIDYLKIDQSFVHNIMSDRISRTITETIIVMAHQLGLKVIAEGVETQEQMDYLVSAGCDYAQGFLFSKAVPASDLQQLLSHSYAVQPKLMQ